MAEAEPVDRFKVECFLFDLELKKQIPLTEAERQNLLYRLYQLIFALDSHTSIVGSKDSRKAG